MSHELLLLSPYKYPGQYPLTLAEEDMASWLNAYTALWHPALLFEAQGPPRVEQPYDHENPKAGFVYVVPTTPPVYLPDDWPARVQAAGAITFAATPDRPATLEALKAALNAEGAPKLGLPEALDDLPADLMSLFFGLGMGYLMQGTLAEAMEHENLLEAAAFWEEVQSALRAMIAPEAPKPAEPTTAEMTQAAVAVTEDLPTDEPPSFNPDDLPPPPEPPPPPPVDAWLKHLQAAAMKLLSAREVLYPVNIHLLDLHLLDPEKFDAPLPSPVELGLACNILASSADLEKCSNRKPELFQLLKTQVQSELIEIVGGLYLDRPDHLLPWDSQVWNLSHGLRTAQRLLGREIRVFGRREFGYHPMLPLALSTHGLTRTLFLTFDEDSAVPTYTNAVVSWTSPDGKEVYAFVRPPKKASLAETFFNLGNTWYKTTREDHNALMFFVHKGEPELPWYRDLIALGKLAPVLGTWETFSKFMTDVMPGEYPPPLAADDLHHDVLSKRIEAKLDDPVSGFARHLRLRRRLDGCWTFAALYRALAGAGDTLLVDDTLVSLENVFESQAQLGTEPGGLTELEKTVAETLAARLQARAKDDQPGTMLLNPCGFARRIALEIEGSKHPIPVEGPVKACQLDGNLLRVVVEVPAFGFTWIPKEGTPNTPPMPSRMKLGDEQTLTIRNEFFEVEVDAATGGLKAIRDHKSRVNRLGQQLVFNPGSRMVATEINVTSSGPALAEIVSIGTIIGPQDQVLANFKQRLRTWLGRPLLEMKIELEPVQAAAGYGWNAYFGARFAWRDERTLLVRGIHGSRHISSHPRPQTAEYLDLRIGQFGTTIITGGLPFHQRQEGRMIDVLLIPEGEKTTTFELGISLDRDVPALTALGLHSPLAQVPTTKGPPHIGSSGWLFHMDMPNFLITRLLPGKRETRPEGTPAPTEPEHAITAQILECTANSGHAEFRCFRDPKRAVVLNGKGDFLNDTSIVGDAITLEVSPLDWIQLQVEW